MRSLAVLFTILTLPVLAVESVSFGKHDRFTLEFPDTWKKPDQPKPGAVVYRERESGDASFSVSRLFLPKNAKVDLHDTLKSFVTNFRKGGMTVVGDVKGQDGLIDGKDSVFAQVPVKLAQGGQNFSLTFFLVIVDCRDQVLVLQATLPDGGGNQVRDDCRRIIGSLHEKDPAEIRKKEEAGKTNKEKDAKNPAEDPAPADE
jgi:hypothetical protein